MRKVILAAMVVGMTASAAWCEEMVENPQYKSWAAFKVGTSIKTQTSSVMTVAGNEMANKSTMTTTLKELTPDKAVLEIAMEGMPEPQKLEVPAKVAKGTETGQQPGVTVTKKGEGDEEVTVGGKKYKCHWVENQVTSDQMESTTKAWTCDSVPGKLVKMVTETTKPMTMKATMELVEVKVGA